jgi:hypothetical protein
MSVIQIDADTINALLKAFASRTGGLQVTFENGRILLRIQGVVLAVNTLQLTDKGVEITGGVSG